MGLTVVTGDHGSGKSVLLRERAAQPGTTGTTRLVPADPALDADRTVAEHGDPDDPTWIALLERFGLTEHGAKLPFMLSRGTATKVQLAQAFWARPDNYLFDEPFNGLDQRGRELFVVLVAEALAAGASVVVATHHVEAFDALPHELVTLT